MLRLIDFYKSLPLLVSLFGFVIMSYLYLTKTNMEVVVIEVNDSTTRIITNETARIDERVNFLRDWVLTYFNYDSSNVEEQIESGNKFLSPALWERQEFAKAKKLIDASKIHNISESSSIKAIDYDEEKDLWTLTLDVSVARDGKRFIKEGTVVVKLIDVERSKFDKWGIQINELIRNI